MEEEWKDIKGYEGLYQISNFGRIKSLKKWNGNLYKETERILKPQKNSRGYLRILLSFNNKKYFFIHRLVAEHFINKPKGCNIVNHLDCNPLNNRVDNLEWTTIQGNIDYMKKLGRNKRTTQWIEKLRETSRKKYSKKVQGTEINGNNVLIYNTIVDVKKDGFQPSCVSNCCNNISRTHKGYTWKFI